MGGVKLEEEKNLQQHSTFIEGECISGSGSQVCLFVKTETTLSSTSNAANVTFWQLSDRFCDPLSNSCLKAHTSTCLKATPTTWKCYKPHKHTNVDVGREKKLAITGKPSSFYLFVLFSCTGKHLIRVMSRQKETSGVRKVSHTCDVYSHKRRGTYGNLGQVVGWVGPKNGNILPFIVYHTWWSRGSLEEEKHFLCTHPSMYSTKFCKQITFLGCKEKSNMVFQLSWTVSLLKGNILTRRNLWICELFPLRGNLSDMSE